MASLSCNGQEAARLTQPRRAAETCRCMSCQGTHLSGKAGTGRPAVAAGGVSPRASRFCSRFCCRRSSLSFSAGPLRPVTELTGHCCESEHTIRLMGCMIAGARPVSN